MSEGERERKCVYCGIWKSYPVCFPHLSYAKCDTCYTIEKGKEKAEYNFKVGAAIGYGVGVILGFIAGLLWRHVV